MKFRFSPSGFNDSKLFDFVKNPTAFVLAVSCSANMCVVGLTFLLAVAITVAISKS
jgi:hypothetical protein